MCARLRISVLNHTGLYMPGQIQTFPQVIQVVKVLMGRMGLLLELCVVVLAPLI